MLFYFETLVSPSVPPLSSLFRRKDIQVDFLPQGGLGCGPGHTTKREQRGPKTSRAHGGAWSRHNLRPASRRLTWHLTKDVVCLQAREVGKNSGRFLFWLKICQPHGPLGVLMDNMGGGNRGEKFSFIPSTFAEGPGLSKLLRVATEMCFASKNPKSNRQMIFKTWGE